MGGKEGFTGAPNYMVDGLPVESGRKGYSDLTVDTFASHVENLRSVREAEGVDVNFIDAELNRLVAANPEAYTAYLEKLRLEQEQKMEGSVANTDPYGTVFWHNGDLSGTIG